jgi:hypothetical protein
MDCTRRQKRCHPAGCGTGSSRRTRRGLDLSQRMPSFPPQGWNQIQINLSDFTRRAYGTSFAEVLRVTVHANCRLRRIYFADRLYSESSRGAWRSGENLDQVSSCR